MVWSTKEFQMLGNINEELKAIKEEFKQLNQTLEKLLQTIKWR